MMDQATPDTEFKFTEGETRLLANAWLCMEGDPKIDFDKLAKLSGYTVGSAKVTFGKVKRKIKLLESGDVTMTATPKKGGRAVATPKTPKNGAKRGAAAAAGNGDSPAPTKKARATPAKPRGKKKVVQQEEPTDDEEVKPVIKKQEVKEEEEDVDVKHEQMDEDDAYGSQVMPGTSLFGEGADYLSQEN